ncbi:MAG: DUF86 domain-containing protein [Phycisphaerales bacterium]|nr:DUF86 domain-containing protein [Phycisphaerales bacterium]
MPPEPPTNPGKAGSIDDRIRVEHMLIAARDAVQFINGRQRQDLDTDAMLLRALTNAIQEIGEAEARLSNDARDRAQTGPWGQIVAMRHVLVHVYWGVDRERLWVTATSDLPTLIADLETACKDWPLPDPAAE